jgi:hypothetical protein
LLPPETESVWRFLAPQRLLEGFVLVGGSALALRLGHRRSEDLDLAFPDTRLPRAHLDSLGRLAAEAGLAFQRQEDEATVLEFAEAGLDPLDYQQNFVVNGKTRVSFFVADAALAKVLTRVDDRQVRVATLAELFKAKCLVSALRSKTRDWVDLYLLMRDHGFSLRDYGAAFREAGIEGQCDTGLSRLCSGVPQRDDEGYAHLLPNPPTLGEMTAFFVAERQRLEVELAAEAMRTRAGLRKEP